MKYLVILSLVALAAPLSIAAAAGPYDGKWSGTAVASAGGPSCSATLNTEIKDNRLKGTELLGGRSSIALSGRVAADGSFVSSGGGFTGKFSGNSFTGTFRETATADCRGWRVTMERAKP
jgi:hypothetical protein